MIFFFLRLVGILDPQWNFGSMLANRLALDTSLIERNFCQVSNSLNSHNFSLACPLSLSYRHASLFQLQAHCPLSPLHRASPFFIANCSGYRCIARSLFHSESVACLFFIASYSGHRGILPTLPLRRTSLFHCKQPQLQVHCLFSFLAVALLLLQVQCLLSSDAHEFVHGINRINETRTVKMGCAN